MAEVTRRRSADHREECWHIITAMFMSVRLPSASEIRTIPINGNGTAGSIRVRDRANVSPTFEEARADFERAWHVFLSKRTEADFRAWRD
jgi:hypothetical protein